MEMTTINAETLQKMFIAGAKNLEAKKEWIKQNTTFIGLKLNNNTDKDILESLKDKPKQTEIKRLIRKGLEHEK